MHWYSSDDGSLRDQQTTGSSLSYYNKKVKVNNCTDDDYTENIFLFTTVEVIRRHFHLSHFYNAI